MKGGAYGWFTAESFRQLGKARLVRDRLFQHQSENTKEATLMSDDIRARVDETFQAAVKQIAVVGALKRKEQRDACVEAGGDALTCWRQQDARSLFFVLPPPPDMDLDAAIYRAWRDLQKAVDDTDIAIQAAMAAVKQEPVVKPKAAWEDLVKATLETKAILDMLERMKQMEECRKGEGDPFYCWEKYHIWSFPFPRPLHPDWLKATTVHEAWAEMSSLAFDLKQAIGAELERQKPPG
jgi:hypothetical protein